MVAFSMLNTRARILIGAAIVVMNQRRKKQLYKKNSYEDFGEGAFLVKECYIVNIITCIKD